MIAGNALSSMLRTLGKPLWHRLETPERFRLALSLGLTNYVWPAEKSHLDPCINPGDACSGVGRGGRRVQQSLAQ